MSKVYQVIVRKPVARRIVDTFEVIAETPASAVDASRETNFQ